MFSGLSPQALCGLCLLLGLGIYRAVHWAQASAIRLPPGPKPLPFIGNVHQISEHQEKTFLSWGRKYGKIVYARFFGRCVLVLNHVSTAKDLLEKRGAVYSDRPRFVLYTEMLQFDIVPMLRYGDRYKKCRRWIQDVFLAPTVAAYRRTTQRREINVMLKGMLSRPDSFVSHLTRFTEAVVLDVTYGHIVRTDNDEYGALGEKSTAALVSASS
ncbi:hypothetical protein EUX98_g6100 [Antrodiella citrinella]|uniref:Cytochrome P450 n=1 Tax=Antrodiella citrinella TaxID=2447956 RepID=A0A4S4MQU1_9APHY|nr:hypothetical protein EUX98_g6100 [Antrodiella citrinella]